MSQSGCLEQFGTPCCLINALSGPTESVVILHGLTGSAKAICISRPGHLRIVILLLCLDSTCMSVVITLKCISVILTVRSAFANPVTYVYNSVVDLGVFERRGKCSSGFAPQKLPYSKNTLAVKKIGEIVFLKHWQKHFRLACIFIYSACMTALNSVNYKILYIERTLHRALKITIDPG